MYITVSCTFRGTFKDLQTCGNGDAVVAQLVEQLICNLQVRGSSPCYSTTSPFKTSLQIDFNSANMSVLMGYYDCFTTFAIFLMKSFTLAKSFYS